MIHQPASPFPSHFPASYDLIRDTSSPSNLSRSLSRGKSFANTIFNQLETTTTFDRNIFVKISTIQILQKSPKRQRHIEAKTRQFIKDIPNGDVKDTLLLLQTFISLSSIIEQLQWNKQKSAIMQKRKWIFGIWQRQDTVNLLKSWTKEQISSPHLMKITLERILCNYRYLTETRYCQSTKKLDKRTDIMATSDENHTWEDTLQLQIDASQPVRTSSVKTWSMAKWLQMSLKSANSICCSLSKPSRPVIFPISARIWRKISILQFSQTTWTLTTSTKTKV